MGRDTEFQKEKFQISLRAARVLSGYTVDEVATSLNISRGMLCRYEQDATTMSVGKAKKIIGLYGLSIDNVYFGSEKDFIKRRKAV